MNSKYLRVFVVAGALSLFAAACTGDDGDSADPPETTVRAEASPATSAVEPEDAPATTAAGATTTTAAPATTTITTAAPTPATTLPSGPPYRAELPSGPFLLNDRTAQKLALDETLSFVLSVGSTGDDGSGLAMGAGFAAGAAESSERHSARIEARVVGPDEAGAAAQAQQIDDLIVQGGLDCLVVEAAEAAAADSGGGLATVIDRAVNSGVPVFTVGGDSADSRRFAFYGLDALGAGARAGEAVGRWAVDGRILLRKAGVLTGDATSERSQRLMEGFIAGITAELPDLEFVNGPDTVESFGFDPVEVYDEAGEWILAHPDVDVVFFTDEGMEPASRFIADRALYGDVSLAGFHMSEKVPNYIREGVVVAAMLPGLAGQAAAAAEACGDFLLAGAYHTGHVAVDPVVVTEDNVEDRDWAQPENR